MRAHATPGISAAMNMMADMAATVAQIGSGLSRLLAPLRASRGFASSYACELLMSTESEWKNNPTFTAVSKATLLAIA